jgi:hypothetical protein
LALLLDSVDRALHSAGLGQLQLQMKLSTPGKDVGFDPGLFLAKSYQISSAGRSPRASSCQQKNRFQQIGFSLRVFSG